MQSSDKITQKELAVLDKLYLPFGAVVIDVGSAYGEYTQAVIDRHQLARVFCQMIACLPIPICEQCSPGSIAPL